MTSVTARSLEVGGCHEGVCLQDRSGNRSELESIRPPSAEEDDQRWQGNEAHMMSALVAEHWANVLGQGMTAPSCKACYSTRVRCDRVKYENIGLKTSKAALLGAPVANIRLMAKHWVDTCAAMPHITRRWRRRNDIRRCTEWAKKVTSLTTTSIWCHINCKTPAIYTDWTTLAFATNYSQFNCAYLLENMSIVFSEPHCFCTHAQLVDETASVNPTIVTKLQFIRVNRTCLHQQTKNDVI